MLLLWFNPKQQFTQPHTATHSLPPGGMRERIRRIKVTKLMGGDKDNLLGKEMCTQTGQNKEFIHCFPGAGSVQP